MAEKKTSKPKVRRPWWQRVCRWLAALALVLAAGYVTLPWWLPKQYVGRLIEKQMSQQLGVPVHLGRFDLSWGDGIEIADLVIDSPPAAPSSSNTLASQPAGGPATQPGSGPIATVGHVRIDFSPVRFALYDRVEWIEVDHPRLHVRFDDDGNCNLDAIHRGPKSETIIRRISVRNAAVDVRLPRHDRTLHLAVSDLQVLSGRLAPVGKITMSGSLQQDGGDSPISLQFSEGDDNGDLAGVASLKFLDVDLQQLQLEPLLGRLRKFSGRCSGSVELQANRQGQIDRFGLDVSVNQLDVQPAEGPSLPVIDKAAIRAAAAYDFVSGQLDIRSSQIVLPGISMKAKASMLLDTPGLWEGIRSLRLSAQVQPQQLAALLGLPQGEVAVEGPVEFDVAVDERSPQEVAKRDVLQLALTARGTEAQIALGDRVLKPHGRTLEARLAGTLELDNWTFTAEGNQWVQLGGNTLGGSGNIRNIRGILSRWAPVTPATAVTDLMRNAMSALAHVDWDGAWQVTDLPSLADLMPQGKDLLKRLDMSGTVGGRWSIDHTDGTAVRVGVTIPAATAISVGNVQKLKGKELKLAVSAQLDEANAMPRLRDVDVYLSLGGGRVHAYNGSLGLGSNEVILGSGGFQVEQVESLLELLHPQARPAAILRGGLDGKYSLRGNAAGSVFTADADLEGLMLMIGDNGKRSGQPASVRLVASHDANDPAADHVNVTYRWNGGEARGTLVMAPGNEAGRLQASLEIRDANSLGNYSPTLARALSQCRLGGRFLASATGVWTADSFEGSVALDANAMDFAMASPHGERRKPAGLPASLRLEGKFWQSSDMGLHADVRSVAIEAPSCGASLTAKARLAAPLTVAQDLLDRPVREFQATLRTHGEFDAALRQLLPEVDAMLRGLKLQGGFWAAGDGATTLSLGGGFTTSTTVELRDGHYLVRGLLDANAMTLSGPLAKPVTMPAWARAEMTLRPDPWRLQLNTLAARLGEDGRSIDVIADGNCRVDFDLAAPLSEMTLQASVSMNDASLLGRVVGPLAAYGMQGAAFAHVRWQDANGGEVTEAKFEATALGGWWQGRWVSLTGSAEIRRLWNIDANHVGIGRLRSDGMTIAMGDATLHVLGEVADPLTRPTGAVEVLADTIDTQDINDWLAGGKAATSKPATRPVAPSATAAAEDGERLAMAARAIAEMHRVLAEANVTIRFSADSLRVPDDHSSEIFDLRYAVTTATIDHGRVAASLFAGINGGEINKRIEFNLNDKPSSATITTSLADVLARPNVQPQISRVFPGNTILGSLSMEQTLKLPMTDLVANMIDPNHEIRPAGGGVTIAKEGIVQGRAAPQFIASIFPGLNLTQYRYNKMTAFAEMKPDGSAENDMIFTGSLYDLYMTGTTDPQHIARYETGVILLSPPQSPQWNHDYHVGRIPLLKIKARIEDGQLLDQEVSYPWPNETLGAIFIRDNFFYRLWINARK